MRENTTGHIIRNWKPEYAEKFGNESLHLQHSLHKSELFTDERLANLIEKAERSHYHVNTRAAGADGKKRRREGEFGKLSGMDILETVKTGDIWINLRAPQIADSAYGDLLADMYAEFEARVPDLKTFKQGTTILISSPNAYVPYHCDVPGQMLWQIRGRKRVWLYPAKEPFLTQEAIEKLIIGEFHETDMVYDEAFDKAADAIDLEPGYMLHWPLNFPHRVENYDCLNVSVTTEHYTAPIRTSYAVNYANGLLRKAGLKAPKRQTSGLIAAAKTGLAGAVKFSGIRNKAAKPYTIDFQVDPTAPHGVRDIEPYQLKL
ncbi:MAG: cupin-like domain-containing protein [Salaquimonas sp.]